MAVWFGLFGVKIGRLSKFTTNVEFGCRPLHVETVAGVEVVDGFVMRLPDDEIVLDEGSSSELVAALVCILGAPVRLTYEEET